MNKRILGIGLMVLPFALLMFSIIGYSISSFLIASSLDSGDVSYTVWSVVRLALSLAGILGILSVFICLPLGIYFLVKRDQNWLEKLDQHPRFQQLSDADTRKIASWSLSAFLSPLIFALGNQLWLWALGTIVPVFCLYAWIKLTLDGRRMAWERLPDSVETFHKRQKIIACVIAAIFLINCVLAAYATWNFVDDTYQEMTLERAEESANQDADSLETTNDDSSLLIGFCENGGDSDEDQVVDNIEAHIGTDPRSADTDGDGYSDYEELIHGYNPNNNLNSSDDDSDGLADNWEKYFYHLDEDRPDTDGDGMNDLDEIRAGRDPRTTGDISVMLKRLDRAREFMISECNKPTTTDTE